MKYIILLILILVISSSCSHRIVRQGYEVNEKEISHCEVVIKQNFKSIDSTFIKLGEVKLKDGGFSSSCTEADALIILKNEACLIGANLINITEEKRPDVASTCYRCEAEFYYAPVSLNLSSDKEYKNMFLGARVTEDRKRVNSMIWGSIIGAILAIALISVL